MLAVAHGVIGALQRHHAVDDAHAVEAARELGARLPHEGEGALPPLAVLVGERPFIEEHAARRDLEPALGMRAVGAGIALDNDLRVLQHRRAHARRTGSRGKAVHPAARKLDAVALADLRNGHCLGVDEAAHLLQALRRQRIGVHLEGRERRDVHVALTKRPIARRTDETPLVKVPYDLVKGGAAHL